MRRLKDCVNYEAQISKCSTKIVAKEIEREPDQCIVYCMARLAIVMVMVDGKIIIDGWHNSRLPDVRAPSSRQNNVSNLILRS